jgi:hypothetical protein
MRAGKIQGLVRLVGRGLTELFEGLRHCLVALEASPAGGVGYRIKFRPAVKDSAEADEAGETGKHKRPVCGSGTMVAMNDTGLSGPAPFL